MTIPSMYRELSACDILLAEIYDCWKDPKTKSNDACERVFKLAAKHGFPGHTRLGSLERAVQTRVEQLRLQILEAKVALKKGRALG